MVQQKWSEAVFEELSRNSPGKQEVPSLLALMECGLTLSVLS